MLGETEKSSDVCRTASLSEMGHEQRAATVITVVVCSNLETVILYSVTDALQ